MKISYHMKSICKGENIKAMKVLVTSDIQGNHDVFRIFEGPDIIEIPIDEVLDSNIDEPPYFFRLTIQSS